MGNVRSRARSGTWVSLRVRIIAAAAILAWAPTGSSGCSYPNFSFPERAAHDAEIPDQSLADVGPNDSSATEDVGVDAVDAVDATLEATTEVGVTEFYAGTNLSGAEFAPATLPGTIDTDYTYPTHAEVDYFVGKGLRVFRIPFLWERLQPSLDAPFDLAELARLKSIVGYAISSGAKAILDAHGSARYAGKVIGSGAAGAPTAAQFAAFWGTLAKAYATDDRVIFGLQNEPHDMATELWLDDANAAIDAIRKAGATNVILVPGNANTGAHSWSSTAYGTPNATVMLGVKDPLSKVVYEVHQFLDADSSGATATCVSPTIGSARLAYFQKWLVDNKARGFLAAYGTADNPVCNAALEDMLTFIDSHRAQWLGWTWWSAGPWWGPYVYSLEPSGVTDKGQLAILLRHL